MARRMRDEDWRRRQWEGRFDPHIAPINRYVDDLRTAGRGWVPYVAPLHGGVDARVLSILRDPGPGTHEGEHGSGFLCVENDDSSADLQCALLAGAGIEPSDLTPWNAYPWYINRQPNQSQLVAGVSTIVDLLGLLPRLRVVLLQGTDAHRAWAMLERSAPSALRGRDLAVVRTYHPSQQALWHSDPSERRRRAERRRLAFEEVAQVLQPTLPQS